MKIRNDGTYKAAGEELSDLYEIVDFPCSGEEQQGVKNRIYEIEDAMKRYDNKKSTESGDD